MNDSLISGGLIVFGCILNSMSLEAIIRIDREAGPIITFAQMLLIGLYALILNCERVQAYRRNKDVYCEVGMTLPGMGYKLRDRIVPLSKHMLLTLLFCVSSIVNNIAFGMVTPTMHMIFRSSGLVSSLVVGYLLFAKRFRANQVVACLCVTAGVIFATFADYSLVNMNGASNGRGSNACLSNCGANGYDGNNAVVSEGMFDDLSEAARVSFGIVLLCFSVVVLSILGHTQETVYQQLKLLGDWKEVVLYQHILSLPYFAFFASNLHSRLVFYFSAFSPNALAHLALLFIVNVASQYACVRGVFLSTSTNGALATTFLTTIRKYLSVLVSVLYFHSPFSRFHALGLALVVCGSYLYSNNSSSSNDREKKEK